MKSRGDDSVKTLHFIFFACGEEIKLIHIKIHTVKIKQVDILLQQAWF